MAIEIRPVRPGEHEEAGRVTADAYREFAPPGNDDWREYLEEIADVEDRAQRTVVLAALEDGRILGTATLELEGRVDAGRETFESRPLEPGQAHVRMLGVHPGARGRRLGRLLMDACLEMARGAGKTYITLNTTARMKAAQAMYESMGFVRGADRVLEDGFVLWSYSLDLQREDTQEAS